MQKLRIENVPGREWKQLLSKYGNGKTKPLGQYDTLDAEKFCNAVILRGIGFDRRPAQTGYLREGSKIVGSVGGLPG